VGVKIKVTCTTCGDLEVSTADVSARVCVDNEDAEDRFTCRLCETTIVKPCDQQVVYALDSVDVPVDFWSIPRVKREARPGPDFTHDDVIDFREVLDDEVAFTQALIDLTS